MFHLNPFLPNQLLLALGVIGLWLTSFVACAPDSPDSSQPSPRKSAEHAEDLSSDSSMPLSPKMGEILTENVTTTQETPIQSLTIEPTPDFRGNRSRGWIYPSSYDNSPEYKSHEMIDKILTERCTGVDKNTSQDGLFYVFKEPSLHLSSEWLDQRKSLVSSQKIVFSSNQFCVPNKLSFNCDVEQSILVKLAKSHLRAEKTCSLRRVRFKEPVDFRCEGETLSATKEQSFFRVGLNFWSWILG